MTNTSVVREVPGFYSIISLKLFRTTPGVTFDLLPMDLLPRIDSIDRVLHRENALSPGAVGAVEHPWYMHPAQDDNLLVLHGTRHVDIYLPSIGRVEHFTVTPHQILQGETVIHDGGAMLVWPRGVFHRIVSGKEGSASLNFAVHYEGFDIHTNFSIYDLHIDDGEYRVIRQGHEDQI